MGAAEKRPAGFKSVPDNSASAMSALGRQRVDRAFEAIEVTRNAIDDDFQRLVVIIAAAFAGRASVAIAVVGCLFLPILPGLRCCLAFNHTPNVESPKT